MVTSSKTIIEHGDDDIPRAIAGGLAILALLIGIGIGWWIWSNPQALSALQESNTRLAADLKTATDKVTTLESRKVEVTSGMTPEACTKMANDIVANSCTAKATTSASSARSPRGSTAASRVKTQRRYVAPARGQSTATATATATGNGAATATATAGGAAPAAASPVTSAGTLEVPPAPAGGTFWGWVPPYATVAAKGKCFADRMISGMPAQCSSVEVFPRQGNESEVEWNSRVAAANGIAKGAKDARGTISGTTFGRVQVK